MKKTVVSAFLVVLMAFSMIGFILVFFPTGQKKDSGKQSKITYLWNGEIPPDVKDRYMYQIGLTIVSYPDNDSYFQTTLMQLPNLTRGYVVLDLGDNFSVESANGFSYTSRENLTKDLCDLMPVKTLPDCLEQQ